MKRIALSERFAFVKFVCAASRFCGGAAAASPARASAASSATMARQEIRMEKPRKPRTFVAKIATPCDGRGSFTNP